MIYPPILSSGDKVAIVAPAGRISDNDLESAMERFQKWGLKIEIGSHVFDGYNFFSANDEGRLSDLQKALDDESVRAIFCARGGYGTGRLIDSLDFRKFLTSPKWIVGFSDITLLHLKLHGLEVASLHGPMARQIGKSIDEESAESIRRILSNEIIPRIYISRRRSSTTKISYIVIYTFNYIITNYNNISRITVH